MTSMAAEPTPLTAPMPKTISPSTTPNSLNGRLMSGGRMVRPRALTSSMSWVMRSAFFISVVMVAAMNSAG